jgi:hypothetical protein
MPQEAPSYHPVRTRKAIHQRHAHRHRHRSSHISNEHWSAPIEHRCPQKSQATAPHRGVHWYTPPEAPSNHPARTRKAIHQRHPHRHSRRSSHISNRHCSAPIEHRCRRPTQATAPHRGDHTHMPTEALCDHPAPTRRAMHRRHAHRHRHRSSHISNEHCSAPIEHRCQRPTQATAPHRRDRAHMPTEAPSNHPARTRKAIHQRHAHRHSHRSSHISNEHCLAPIEHRCRRPTQATLPHRGDPCHMQAAAPSNHPARTRKSHTPASCASPQPPPPTHQQRTLSRSNRASLPAFVTSHRATST